jgi:hypothetical protein
MRQGGFAAMNRKKTAHWLAMLVVGAICVTPALANDDEASLQKQLDDLRSQVELMKAKQAQRVDDEVESYLDGNSSWTESQGDDAFKGITLGALFTGVNQNTLNLESGENRAVVSGQILLNLNFQVSDNLSIFSDLFANTEGHLDEEFGTPTIAGAFDGIGVDSSSDVRPQGGVQIYEAGIRYAIPAGNQTVNMELGLLDPRTRFLTSAFTDDYRTQFLHNEFVDPSAVNWISNQSSAPTVLGAYFCMAFGANKNIIVRAGWFNEPGRWFDHGQLYLEIHWKGEIKGRAMNAKFMYLRDSYYKDVSLNDKSDNGWGFEWDWMATDNIGVYVILSGNTEDTNPTEFSWSVGGVWNGVGQSRPDDQVGLAFGMLTPNSDILTDRGQAEDKTESVLEIYYKYMTENGKMQVTPHIMWINNPGAGNWTDDSMWILGLRIHVPF